MLTIHGQKTGRFCDGVSRRDFLRIGGLALGGLSLPQILRAAAGAGMGRSHKAVIMIFLPGGPSHQDIFDLKMDAPLEIRGPFKPISTSVPGIQISEHMPHSARIMDKLVPIRSLYGSLTGDHDSHICYTGRTAQGAHFNETTLLVRTRPGVPVAAAVRAAARALDPALPLFQVETLADSLRRNSSFRREGTLFVAAFGVLALVLAGVGLYGVVAFAVGERRREIGVRMALGARARDVVALFVRRGARLAAIGVAVGLLATAAVTRLLAGMLFGITPMDLATLAGASALLAGVALLASAVPARRAARIDPASALRAE